jgi:hypothetical protein
LFEAPPAAVQLNVSTSVPAETERRAHPRLKAIAKASDANFER